MARQGPADAGELDRQEPGHALPLQLVASGRPDELEVFTTRPDTIFGASFVAVSPDHPDRAGAGRSDPAARLHRRCKTGGTTAAELETAEKKGFDTGLTVSIPLDRDGSCRSTSPTSC
jgi:leucyl-tRNA synthetase